MWSYQPGSKEMGEKRELPVHLKYFTDVFGDEVIGKIKLQREHLETENKEKALGDIMRHDSKPPPSTALPLYQVHVENTVAWSQVSKTITFKEFFAHQSYTLGKCVLIPGG